MSRRVLLQLACAGLLGITACSTAGVPAQGSPDLGAVDLMQDTDLAKAAGDSLPRGAVSFFNQQSCPLGWTPFAAAAGRTLLPTVGHDPGGGTQGTPLDDSEDRVHGHDVPALLQPSSVRYAGIAGEANHGVASASEVAMKVTATTVSSGLPYVQLLVCQKTAEADPAQKAAPSGLLMFFAAADCPTGWIQGGLSQGRFLVGVPSIGNPGQTFGGKPLTSLEQRTHQHVFNGQIETTAHGIELVSGGLATGYAHNDKYTHQTTSAAAAVELPYVQLLQCQKM